MSEKSLGRPFVGTAVLVFRDGKFLFQQRKGSHGEGTWSTPGGYLEYGESFEQCAAREVMEESGMEISNIRIAGVTNDMFATHNKHFVTIWLMADWKSGEPYITEPDKCIAQQWVDFDTLPEPLFQPYHQMFESDFYSELKRQLALSGGL